MEYFIDVGTKQNKVPNYQDVKTCPVGHFLSARYKGCALEQAKAILKSYFRRRKKHKGKELKKPEIRNISLKLDERFFKLERGGNSFDFWLKLRDPEKQEWVMFPIKNYEYAKEYFENWLLSPFVEILQKDGKWYVKLMFKKTVELRQEKPKGIDIGYRKLIATSDGKVYGEHLKQIIERDIDRKNQHSKNWKQKKHFLKTEINRILKKVIDGTFSPVIEELKNLKKGKKGKWSKAVNRKFNNWLYGHTLTRIKELCEVTGVQWHTVPPAYTSRTCPMCGYRDKLNRNGDVFMCLRCNYQEDADIVGAKNILMRFIEESTVPLPTNNPFIVIE
ncbi:zinc ribbon domain-containing protein [Candidatus Caldatribacterium sp.]|uniref:zinc ribbon domain-containing protein n=1 Tax=Candidatus Caldatribacterium sp. TaxID=2282143 RepID=UPI003843A32A|nr:transposase [Candidatus Caldatribacterium sp.]